MDINQLRSKHPVFTYKSFKWTQVGLDIQIEFKYLLDPDIEFKPTLTLHNLESNQLDPDLFSRLIFHLGLMEIPTYWKAACPPLIKIDAAPLSIPQIGFLKKLLIQGMGEFYYVNQIDFTASGFLHIESAMSGKNRPYTLNLYKSPVLTPIGGGKDSIVSLEYIKTIPDMDPLCFMVNPNTRMEKLSEMCDDVVKITRKIDPFLLTLNKSGYLNGHTPFSSVLAFLAVTVAALKHLKFIAFSNESSSNESNVEYLNYSINHQYTKSYTFELDMNRYVKENLIKDMEYFSLLRGLDETAISQKFAGMKKYHQLFLSCNKGGKKGDWCGHCPKCIATYLLLSLYLDRNELDIIFKENFLDNHENQEILEQLAGLSSHKPFECVPRYDEIRHAILYLAHSPNPPLLISQLAPKLKTQKKSLIPTEHNLPSEFMGILKS